jgi:cell division septal protein FtsQ
MSSTRSQGKRAARERLAAERAQQARARQRRARTIRIAAALAVVLAVVGVGVLVQLNRSKVNEDAPLPAGIGAVGR